MSHHAIHRRAIVVGAIGFSGALALAGCSTPGGAPSAAPTATAAAPQTEFTPLDEIAALCAADGPDELVISTFSTHEDLLGSAFAPFEEATGIDVKWLGNDLGDRLTKMAAEVGNPSIDIAIVPISEVPTLLANGIIEPENPNIPNYSQLIDAAKMPGGYGAAVLQMGISYNPDYIDEPTSWEDFLNPEYAGRVGISAIPNSTSWGLLAMLERNLGGDESDLTAAIEEIAEIKDDIVITSGNPQDLLDSGELWLMPGIGGQVLAQQDAGLNIAFAIPKEGGPAGMNVVVIPAGSDHLACTEALVGYSLGQDVQNAWVTTQHYGSVSSLYEAPADASFYPQDYSTLVSLDWDAIAGQSADAVDRWNRSVGG